MLPQTERDLRLGVMFPFHRSMHPNLHAQPLKEFGIMPAALENGRL
jgi:hypothetical protein